MADYTIYVLDESALTIDGAVLDGVTQGDGSHLVGRTITLNSAAWQPVDIADNDTDFRDNDGGQRLLGAQTIDGVTYADGTRVEAEYGLTLSDGVNEWQVVGFNLRNSSPAYGTVEGLAFIGGPGGFPPIGVPLTVIEAREGPNYQVNEYATPICFCAGTMILTPDGERPVEELRPGDAILTRDNGTQILRWVGRRRMPALGRFAPVRIAKGALMNSRDLLVSPQHRMLISSARAELLFGAPEVLIPAIHLVNGGSIAQVAGGMVDYVHLLFDAHEIIFAEGIATESLFPGDMATGALDAESLAEILAIFPELEGSFTGTARPCLRAHEAALLSPGAVVSSAATHRAPPTVH